MDGVGLVERYLRSALVAGDAAVLAASVATDELREIVNYFRVCFTDLELTELGPIFASANGDHVACYGVMHMRQVQEFLHVKAVGHSADVGFTAIYHIVDEKIAALWAEFDFAALYA